MKNPDLLGSPWWGERLAERGYRELPLVAEYRMARMGRGYFQLIFWDSLPPWTEPLVLCDLGLVGQDDLPHFYMCPPSLPKFTLLPRPRGQASFLGSMRQSSVASSAAEPLALIRWRSSGSRKKVVQAVIDGRGWPNPV